MDKSMPAYFSHYRLTDRRAFQRDRNDESSRLCRQEHLRSSPSIFRLRPERDSITY